MFLTPSHRLPSEAIKRPLERHEDWLASCEDDTLGRALTIESTFGKPGFKEATVIEGWVDEVESEVLAYLQKQQHSSLDDLAAALRISEAVALSYVTILARKGKVSIGGLDVRGN